MFGSFLPSLWSLCNQSLLGSRSRHCYAIMYGKRGGLNGSTQHFLAVYSQESENLKFVVGVDSDVERSGPSPTASNWKDPLSSAGIGAGAHWCFRSIHAARDFADRRSKPVPPWPW